MTAKRRKQEQKRERDRERLKIRSQSAETTEKSERRNDANRIRARKWEPPLRTFCIESLFPGERRKSVER